MDVSQIALATYLVAVFVAAISPVPIPVLIYALLARDLSSYDTWMIYTLTLLAVQIAGGLWKALKK